MIVEYWIVDRYNGGRGTALRREKQVSARWRAWYERHAGSFPGRPAL